MPSSWYSPVAGPYRVTSPYLGGFRRTGGHSGVDFAAPRGSLVRAVAPGVVIFSGYSGGYGNLIKVRHPDGSIGYYAHNSRNSVRVGQRVGRGSQLALVGSTGNSTGPHSHFEVRRGGRPVDPSAWLSGNYRASATINNSRREPGYYDGVRLSAEQLRNAQTIISVGMRMGASQRDLIIGIMTAMQESNLRNLNYGDRDSLGLFQQRPSAGWGSPSQVRNPQYAAGKFFENLLRLRGRNAMRLTQAAQAVQRSAFPEAYAKWEELARAVVGSPGAGSYYVGGYDRFYSQTVTAWNDPAAVFASLQLASDPTMTLSAEQEGPAASPIASPAESFESAPAGSIDEGEETPLEAAEDAGAFSLDWGPAFAEPGAPAPVEPVTGRRPAATRPTGGRQYAV